MTFAEEAFITGYHHGSISRANASWREAETRFPAWSHDQIEAYLNGVDDGVNCDSTRYSMIQRRR